MSQTLSPTVESPRRSLLRIYRAEIRCELLKLLRLPAFAVPTLAFPAMFYLLFGVAFGAGRSYGGVGAGTYLLASYEAFGVMGAALFGFGVGIAIERGQGWMLLKRASPMPLGAYFAAKIGLAMIFGAAIVAVLTALGLTLGDVAAEPGLLLRLAGVQIAGALPFCALGLFIGYLAGPNSAPAIVNLLYLPMSFAAGMWFPIQALPGFVQRIGVWLPAYHYTQLVLKVVGADRGKSPLLHLGYLAVFTAVSLLAARLAYRRDEDRTWG